MIDSTVSCGWVKKILNKILFHDWIRHIFLLGCFYPPWHYLLEIAWGREVLSWELLERNCACMSGFDLGRRRITFSITFYWHLAPCCKTSCEVLDWQLSHEGERVWERKLASSSWHLSCTDWKGSERNVLFCFSILESWAGRGWGISYTGSLLLSQYNWAFGFVYPSSFLFSCHWFAQACSD
jgi:hypothetical protein